MGCHARVDGHRANGESQGEQSKLHDDSGEMLANRSKVEVRVLVSYADARKWYFFFSNGERLDLL